MQLFAASARIVTSGPPARLHDELHMRRARHHVVEAVRDLGDLDPTLSGVLASVVEALDVSIKEVSSSWR